MYAYHIIKLDTEGNSNFIGNSIIPLNKLKFVDPEKYEVYFQKCAGRDDVQNIVWNPNLDSTFNLGDQKIMWGDVSYFSLHNPKLIFDFFKMNNLLHKQNVHAYKIPLDRFSKKSLIWMFTKSIENNLLDMSDALPLSKITEIDISDIPEKAKQYFLSMSDPSKRLLFKFVPHLLTVDPVKFIDCEIVRVS